MREQRYFVSQVHIFAKRMLSDMGSKEDTISNDIIRKRDG